jgi:hypothetical protein
MLFSKSNMGILFRAMNYSEFDVERMHKEYGNLLHIQNFLIRQLRLEKKGEQILSISKIIHKAEEGLNNCNFVYSVYKLINFIYKYKLKVYKMNPIEYATRPIKATVRNLAVEYHDGFRQKLVEETRQALIDGSSTDTFLARDAIRKRIRKRYLFNLDTFYTDLTSTSFESMAHECSVYLAEINKHRPIPPGYIRLPDTEYDIINQIQKIPSKDLRDLGGTIAPCTVKLLETYYHVVPQVIEYTIPKWYRLMKDCYQTQSAISRENFLRRKITLALS